MLYYCKGRLLEKKRALNGIGTLIRKGGVYWNTLALEHIQMGRLLEITYIVRVELNRIFAVYVNARVSREENGTNIIKKL